MPGRPALLLAPMEGMTDAPMRALQGEVGAFTFAVSEFLRVAAEVPPVRVFHRHVPELSRGGRTPDGLPVQVQLLGGDPARMAAAALVACEAGAQAVDINFGCPAKTVNRHDGGATLLQYPARLGAIVTSVRDALPPHVPVSAKLRLGWDDPTAVLENAARAADGGAAWVTIHARTRAQGYRPPVLWEMIGQVRSRLGIPVVANGDIWSLSDLFRCRAVTGCDHFMLGRGALANPVLSRQAAQALELPLPNVETSRGWQSYLRRLVELTGPTDSREGRHMVCRLKQWLKVAELCGDFSGFEAIKRTETVNELLSALPSDILSSEPISKSMLMVGRLREDRG